MTAKPLPDLDPKHGYLMSMTLENVRCFGSPAEELSLASPKDLSKPARWTVILGANGVGKTTVLRALAFYSDMNIALLDLPQTSKLSRAGYEFGTLEIRNCQDFKVKLEIGFQSGIHSETLNRPSTDSGYASEVQPLLAGYGAGRGVGDSSSNTGHIDNLFDANAKTRDPSQVWSRTEYRATVEGTSNRKTVSNLRNALIEMLPIVSDVHMAFGNDDEPILLFKTEDGWIALDDMSWGYQVFAAFAVDYASRLIQWYPDSKTPLHEPGICLVDELDLHMHPKWQREVIDHLSNVFPATQFIVTVHSPLVVQAAEDANLVVLKRYPHDPTRVQIDNDVEAIKGWRIDQVLTSDLFGLDSPRPPSVERALEERRSLLAQDNLTRDDTERLKSLDAMAMELSSPESKWEKEAQALVLEAAASLKARA